MAVLWDRMVFSFSSYSWKMSGLRAFLGSARDLVSEGGPWTERHTRLSALTSPDELEDTQRNSQDDGVRKPVPLGDGRAQDEQAGGDVDPIDVLLRGERFLSHRVVSCRGVVSVARGSEVRSC